MMVQSLYLSVFGLILFLEAEGVLVEESEFGLKVFVIIHDYKISLGYSTVIYITN